jgi:hypothetical protein
MVRKGAFEIRSKDDIDIGFRDQRPDSKRQCKYGEEKEWRYLGKIMWRTEGVQRCSTVLLENEEEKVHAL